MAMQGIARQGTAVPCGEWQCFRNRASALSAGVAVPVLKKAGWKNAWSGEAVCCLALCGTALRSIAEHGEARSINKKVPFMGLSCLGRKVVN